MHVFCAEFELICLFQSLLFPSVAGPSQMKLDSSLASANVITPFLPPEVTVIGTSLVVFMIILFGQYHYLKETLKALRLLVSDIDKATQEAFAGISDEEFIINITRSRRQFRRSASQCRVRYHGLSTTSWREYPVGLIRLHWNVRVARRDGRALLASIQMHEENQNMKRL
ncbi:hypothetical protein C8J56DRAFT_1066009 [Mycena floridula]|nr:hypothetical protein C8J56DRAFT_1066009 [Mycena floridula]